MNEQQYTVGQVLFLAIMEQLKVIPVKVIKVVQEYSEEGCQTEHIILFPGIKEKNTAILSKLKYPIYTKYEDVSNELKERACKGIDEIVEIAVGTAEKYFGYDQENIFVPEENNIPTPNSSSATKRSEQSSSKKINNAATPTVKKGKQEKNTIIKIEEKEEPLINTSNGVKPAKINVILPEGFQVG